jgi:hypothetical protein
MPTATELNVNTSASALDMANTMFGDGVTVVSASYSGVSAASGTYTGGNATLGQISPGDEGVILSTGRATDFTNGSGTSNTNTAANTSTRWGDDDDDPGDALLEGISGQSIFDAAVLEATFVPVGDTLTMQLVFSSEEYLEFVNAGFNDAVGVWVNGNYVPLELTDGGSTDITINAINDQSNANLYLDNASDQLNTEMDGTTVVLSLTAPVNPGEENDIRIAIGDAGDGIYDSNLLILANSVQVVNIAEPDSLAQGPNTTQVHNILANDQGTGHVITHINNTAVTPGDTVSLPTGEAVTLNADGTISIATDGDIGANTFSYSTVDQNGTPATGFVTIETTATPPDFIVEGTGAGEVIDATYTGDPEGDMIDAFDHSDASNADLVQAGGGNDTVLSGAGDDTVFGGAGDDVIDGGTGADSLVGGAGDDTILVAQGDTAEGGDGDDTFILSQIAGESGPITITGGEGDETGGDTLVLTSDIGKDDIAFTNTDDAAGGLSGSFEMADGTLVTFSEIENIICFTPGTRILTPRGERPVESLRPGDLVITRDHGPQPLRWTGRRTVPGQGRFAPVRVGPAIVGTTSDGLLVSPQHRLLFTGYHAELLFGSDEVLVAAKHLVGGTDACVAPCAAVTYIHLMFDRHEVIYAEGFASESFFAGDEALSAVDAPAREELFAVFPELRSSPARHRETARPCLRAREAALLRERLADCAA